MKRVAGHETKRRVVQTPKQIAKGAIAKRGKPSAVPGNMKLTVTLDVKRMLARAVRGGVNIESVIVNAVKEAFG